jgi:hypothetical protein
VAKLKNLFEICTRRRLACWGSKSGWPARQRKWSEANLAERAGISRATLQKIEAGAMSPAIGLVFEVATLAGSALV